MIESILRATAMPKYTTDHNTIQKKSDTSLPLQDEAVEEAVCPEEQYSIWAAVFPSSESKGMH